MSKSVCYSHNMVTFKYWRHSTAKQTLIQKIFLRINDQRFWAGTLVAEGNAESAWRVRTSERSVALARSVLCISKYSCISVDARTARNINGKKHRSRVNDSLRYAAQHNTKKWCTSQSNFEAEERKQRYSTVTCYVKICDDCVVWAIKASALAYRTHESASKYSYWSKFGNNLQQYTEHSRASDKSQ